MSEVLGNDVPLCSNHRLFLMNIFDKRVNFKPFEYPETMDFVDKMNKTFWVHSEVEFTSDVQHFHSHLSDIEREVVKRSLLGIAQVEVAVKTFWARCDVCRVRASSRHGLFPFVGSARLQ